MGLFGVGKRVEKPRLLGEHEISKIAANDLLEHNRFVQGNLANLNLECLSERSEIALELAQTQTNYIEHVLKAGTQQKHKDKVQTAIGNLQKLMPELKVILPAKHTQIKKSVTAMHDMHHQL